MEASGLYDKQLYFLSGVRMDDELLEPRIPDNYFTKNGYEDSKTPRICVAQSIGKCLMGLSQNLTGAELYVHILDEPDKGVLRKSLYKPTAKEVPDSAITGELWITVPMNIRCIGKIKVISDDGKKGHKFTYGDGMEAELYGWKWKWVDKYHPDIYKYDNE